MINQSKMMKCYCLMKMRRMKKKEKLAKNNYIQKMNGTQQKMKQQKEEEGIN